MENLDDLINDESKAPSSEKEKAPKRKGPKPSSDVPANTPDKPIPTTNAKVSDHSALIALGIAILAIAGIYLYQNYLERKAKEQDDDEYNEADKAYQKAYQKSPEEIDEDIYYNDNNDGRV